MYQKIKRYETYQFERIDNNNSILKVIKEIHMVKFGELMKIKMEKKNIKQDELAKAIGVTRSAVNAYCNNYGEPDIATLFRICDVLKIDLSEYADISRKGHEKENLLIEDKEESRVILALRQLEKEKKRRMCRLILHIIEETNGN